MTRILRVFPIVAGLAAFGVTPVETPVARAAKVAKLQRVAVVDVQRVILETREGRRAKKDLERTFAKSQARLEAKQRDLQKRFEDLQAKAPMLSERMLLQRQQELVRSQSELERLTMELQEEIVQKEGLLTEKIYKKVAVIVRQIALEEKVQTVLVRGEMTVLFANPKLDLTNRVIVVYDKKHK